MRQWMGGRKLFNGLESIFADPLTNSLVPYSLSPWEREVIMAMMDLDHLPISPPMLWSIDTVLEAAQEVLEEGRK
jgi:hypothetical protein